MTWGRKSLTIGNALEVVVGLGRVEVNTNPLVVDLVLDVVVVRRELDVDVRVGAELLSCTHEYPERLIELHFFECVLNGEPRAMLGQEMRWVPRTELRSLQFPPADDELIDLLQGT